MNSDLPKSPRRWLRRTVITLAALLALYAAYRYTLHRIVEAKLNEIRQQGYPVTLAELDKWYPQPPSGKNAATLYLKAFKLFKEYDLLRRNHPLNREWNLSLIWKPERPPSTEWLEEQSEILQENAAALTLLHKAIEFHQCRYPVDLSQPEPDLPHLDKVHYGLSLLKSEAELFARQGDAQRTVDSLLALLALSHSLANEPLLVSQIERSNNDREVASSLAGLLSKTSLTDTQLIRLATALAKTDDNNSMYRGYAGELCEELSYLDNAARWYWRRNSKFRYSLKFRLTDGKDWALGKFDLVLLHYLNQVKSYVEMCRKPLAERERLRSSRRDAGYKPSFSGTRLWLERDWVRFNIRDLTFVRTCLVALAVERYRLAQGRLPETLNELTPTFLCCLPIDPYTGQSFLYKRLLQGYTVYSGYHDWDGNITFTVER